MEKTINCAECGNSFTYEPSPNYPDKRKYCKHCGDIKAESYSKFKNASETKPTHTPEGEPLAKEEDVPVEKIGVSAEREEYEIGRRRVRCKALDCAIEISKLWDRETGSGNLIELAKRFEKYILGEEIKD